MRLDRRITASREKLTGKSTENLDTSHEPRYNPKHQIHWRNDTMKPFIISKRTTPPPIGERLIVN